jgi:hypothetical protein
MSKNKYEKYFITETPPNPKHPQSRIKGNDMPFENTLYISEGLNGTIKDAPYLETNMVLRTSKGAVTDSKPHSHPFGEYLIFLGTDPEDQFKLGGEVEFWIDNEKHLITRSCAVFVPAHISHCPLFFHRVDRPFMFITTANAITYEHDVASNINEK